jgi:hypothetical protein
VLRPLFNFLLLFSSQITISVLPQPTPFPPEIHPIHPKDTHAVQSSPRPLLPPPTQTFLPFPPYLFPADINSWGKS